MDIAFRFASRFEQCLYCGALVNIFSQQSPPFLLVLPDWVVRKLWGVDQGVEIGTSVRCVQSGFSNIDICTEVIMRTLNGLLLAGLHRRCREGTILMMAQAFDGGCETWSSKWGTLASRTSIPTT